MSLKIQQGNLFEMLSVLGYHEFNDSKVQFDDESLISSKSKILPFYSILSFLYKFYNAKAYKSVFLALGDLATRKEEGEWRKQACQYCTLAGLSKPPYRVMLKPYGQKAFDYLHEILEKITHKADKGITFMSIPVIKATKKAFYASVEPLVREIDDIKFDIECMEKRKPLLMQELSKVSGLSEHHSGTVKFDEEVEVLKKMMVPTNFNGNVVQDLKQVNTGDNFMDNLSNLVDESKAMHSALKKEDDLDSVKRDIKKAVDERGELKAENDTLLNEIEIMKNKASSKIGAGCVLSDAEIQKVKSHFYDVINFNPESLGDIPPVENRRQVERQTMADVHALRQEKSFSRDVIREESASTSLESDDDLNFFTRDVLVDLSDLSLEWSD